MSGAGRAEPTPRTSPTAPAAPTPLETQHPTLLRTLCIPTSSPKTSSLSPKHEEETKRCNMKWEHGEPNAWAPFHCTEGLSGCWVTSLSPGHPRDQCHGTAVGTGIRFKPSGHWGELSPGKLVTGGFHQANTLPGTGTGGGACFPQPRSLGTRCGHHPLCARPRWDVGLWPYSPQGRAGGTAACSSSRSSHMPQRAVGAMAQLGTAGSPAQAQPGRDSAGDRKVSQGAVSAHRGQVSRNGKGLWQRRSRGKQGQDKVLTAALPSWHKPAGTGSPCPAPYSWGTQTQTAGVWVKLTGRSARKIKKDETPASPAPSTPTAFESNNNRLPGMGVLLRREMRINQPSSANQWWVLGVLIPKRSVPAEGGPRAMLVDTRAQKGVTSPFLPPQSRYICHPPGTQWDPHQAQGGDLSPPATTQLSRCPQALGTDGGQLRISNQGPLGRVRHQGGQRTAPTGRVPGGANPELPGPPVGQGQDHPQTGTGLGAPKPLESPHSQLGDRGPKRAQRQAVLRAGQKILPRCPSPSGDALVPHASPWDMGGTGEKGLCVGLWR